MQSRKIRIGTRASPLALWQANEVRRRLIDVHKFGADVVELVKITTTGDRIQDKALRQFGGKGLFSKEIEEALLADEIDLAVHSMKDLQTVLPEGLGVACILPREDVRDAFLSLKAENLRDLPEGAVVGTASLRRQAQVKRLRPDLKVTTFRGNVETRLRKLAEGDADATFLASAGLKRLGLEDRITAIMPVGEMLPAVAQGAIGVETRNRDDEIKRLLVPLNDKQTAICVAVERAFLAELDGSCRTPIAGLAEFEGDELTFRGIILRPDGSEWHETAKTGRAGDAVAIGREAAVEVRGRVTADFFSDVS